jgi:hypothetical protein
VEATAVRALIKLEEVRNIWQVKPALLCHRTTTDANRHSLHSPQEDGRGKPFPCCDAAFSLVAVPDAPVPALKSRFY